MLRSSWDPGPAPQYGRLVSCQQELSAPHHAFQSHPRQNCLPRWRKAPEVGLTKSIGLWSINCYYSYYDAVIFIFLMYIFLWTSSVQGIILGLVTTWQGNFLKAIMVEWLNKVSAWKRRTASNSQCVRYTLQVFRDFFLLYLLLLKLYVLIFNAVFSGLRLYVFF